MLIGRSHKKKAATSSTSINYDKFKSVKVWGVDIKIANSGKGYWGTLRATARKLIEAQKQKPNEFNLEAAKTLETRLESINSDNYDQHTNRLLVHLGDHVVEQPSLAPIIAGEKIDDTFTTKITHFASKDLIRHHALTLVHMKTLTGVSGYGKFKLSAC
jgi:hypothetical protein